MANGSESNDNPFNPVSGISGVRQDDVQQAGTPASPYMPSILALMSQMRQLDAQGGQGQGMFNPMASMGGGGMPQQQQSPYDMVSGGGLRGVLHNLGVGAQEAGLAMMPSREYAQMSGERDRNRAAITTENLRNEALRQQAMMQYSRQAQQEQQQRRAGVQNQLMDMIRMMTMDEQSKRQERGITAGFDKLSQQEKFSQEQQGRQQSFAQEQQSRQQAFASEEQRKLFSQQDKRDADRWAHTWKLFSAKQADEKPTADERRRADLANNVNENLNQFEDIVRRRPELFGKLAGRWTDIRSAIGSDDPDVAKLRVIRDQLGIASIGAHAMRNYQGAEALGRVLASMHNSASAALTTIMTARTSVGTFQSDVGEAPGKVRQGVAGAKPKTGGSSNRNVPPPGAKIIELDDYLKQAPPR